MFKPNDPYTYTFYSNLLDTSLASDFQEVGIITVHYQVSHYNNVQLNNGTTNQGQATPNTREYILTCTQRVTLFNYRGLQVGPEPNITDYENYPALVQSSMTLLLTQGAQAVQLLGYSPQTINTQVQTSGNRGSGSENSQSSSQSATSSQSRTTGSSMSETHSYSANVGLQGDVFSCGLGHDHSSTRSVSLSTSLDHSDSNSIASGHNSSNNASNSANMNIKDWSVYSYVNPTNNSVHWNYSQEYPWNVLECRSQTDTKTFNPNNHNQVQLNVPASMTSCLYNEDVLYPPSHLSTFGMNLVSQSQSKIIVNEASSSTVTVQHHINLYTASHSLSGNQVSVYMDQSAKSLCPQNKDNISVELDLSVLALSPVKTSAIVGFIPNKFAVSPQQVESDSSATHFCIFSDNNQLKVIDTTSYGPTTSGGFSSSLTSLNAKLDSSCPSLTFRTLFKVIDTVSDYALYLKHWKTQSSTICLTIVVNGDTNNTIVKYVDALEAEGGENNLLAITLRNQNFSSVEYNDMLTLGLNSIDITISSVDATDAGYALRALSIEAS